jgi:hypothetical protein
MNKVNQLFHLIKNMGLRYVLFRINYGIQKKIGLLRFRFPIDVRTRSFITVEEWRKLNTPYLFQSKESLKFRKKPSKGLKYKAENVLNGKIEFFSSQWHDLGLDYDWVTNPETGYSYDVNIHWSKISDFSPEAGDIKYVWEKSRFTFLNTILKYDYHFDEDHSEWIFSQIDSWIKCNPINKGPNWHCSQEISIRLMNWMHALFFYRNSKHLTDARWNTYQNSIYWQLHHVYENINFSRIAVRNNHAITETLMLSLSNMLFPFIPESKRWSQKGRKWVENEIAYQIYEDGTYLQFSMNYHRVVVQLLTLGIRLSEIHNKPFGNVVYDRAYQSIRFLYHCQTPKGFVPNYGANDGALFFQWTDQDFRDFRPQLDALHQVLTAKSLYPNEDFEDKYWWGSNTTGKMETIERNDGVIGFPNGGYFVIRDKESFTFMRCGNHKDRPSQADNLHVDIWVNDENVIRDSGSFKYNADNEDIQYFMGTKSHNTVMLDTHDQMLKGSRFIWNYWTQSISFNFEENSDYYILSGSIKAFGQISNKIIHQRKLVKWKNRNKWEIEDTLEGVPKSIGCQQLWHGDNKILGKIIAIENEIELNTHHTQDWDSKYYGKKEKNQMNYFNFNKSIKTKIDLD